MHNNNPTTLPQQYGVTAAFAVPSPSNSARDSQVTASPGLSIMAQELLPRLGQMSGRMQRIAQCLRQTPESDKGSCGPNPSDISSAIYQAHSIVSYCEGVLSDIENSLGV